MAQSGNALAYDSTSSGGREQTKVAIRDDRVYGVNVAGLPWAEIDFPYDLDRARREVWPVIEKSQSKKAQVWKRARWAVTKVSLTRPNGTQRCWMVDRGDSAIVDLETSGTIRLELMNPIQFRDALLIRKITYLIEEPLTQASQSPSS